MGETPRKSKVQRAAVLEGIHETNASTWSTAITLWIALPYDQTILRKTTSITREAEGSPKFEGTMHLQPLGSGHGTLDEGRLDRASANRVSKDAQ